MLQPGSIQVLGIYIPILGDNMQVTIQQIIDTIINSIPGGPLADTVDTVKTGDPS